MPGDGCCMYYTLAQQMLSKEQGTFLAEDRDTLAQKIKTDALGYIHQNPDDFQGFFMQSGAGLDHHGASAEESGTM